MEDAIIQLIFAVSALLSAVGGILGFFAAKFHLGKKVDEVAQGLQESDAWTAEHEVQLKTGIVVAKELSPEAKAVLDKYNGQIQALADDIKAKSAALEELKKTLPIEAPKLSEAGIP